MSSEPPRAETVLRACDLDFRHPSPTEGERFHLRVDRLEVLRGEVLALCGSSGSGKTTLLEILAGLLRPQSGRVMLTMGESEVDLHGGTVAEWRARRRHLGFVHQDPRGSLNDRRVVADIVADPLHIHGIFDLPGRSARYERAIAMLDHVGITRTQAARRPEALSGGQRQRVAIARALVTRPRLVFLDEPTSALDVSVQASIVELLQSLRREDAGTSYVLVTHDLALARQLADRVAILDRGRIVEIGAIDGVFRDPISTVTRELLGLARAAPFATSGGIET